MGLLKVTSGPKVNKFELESVRIHQDVLVLDVSESVREEDCFDRVKVLEGWEDLCSTPCLWTWITI